MRYVYACPSDHRMETEHPMNEDPEVICAKCGSIMHRVPQPFTFYTSPFEVLTDRMTDEFGAWRHKGRQGVAEYNKKHGEI